MVAFEIARGTGSQLTWPRSRTTSPSTCCPRDPDRLTYAGRSVLRYPRTSRVAEQIQLADEAVTAYLARV